MLGVTAVFKDNIVAMAAVFVPSVLCFILLQFLLYLFFYTGHTLMFLKWESS